MARMTDSEGTNSNIVQQHQDWQQQRRENGEDVNDWSAFREHLMAIGAPDPGEDELEDFRTDGAEQDMQTARETTPL